MSRHLGEMGSVMLTGAAWDALERAERRFIYSSTRRFKGRRGCEKVSELSDVGLQWLGKTVGLVCDVCLSEAASQIVAADPFLSWPRFCRLPSELS